MRYWKRGWKQTRCFLNFFLVGFDYICILFRNFDVGLLHFLFWYSSNTCACKLTRILSRALVCTKFSFHTGHFNNFIDVDRLFVVNAANNSRHDSISKQFHLSTNGSADLHVPFDWANWLLFWQVHRIFDQIFWIVFFPVAHSLVFNQWYQQKKKNLWELIYLLTSTSNFTLIYERKIN